MYREFPISFHSVDKMFLSQICEMYELRGRRTHAHAHTPINESVSGFKQAALGNGIPC